MTDPLDLLEKRASRGLPRLDGLRVLADVAHDRHQASGPAQHSVGQGLLLRTRDHNLGGLAGGFIGTARQPLVGEPREQDGSVPANGDPVVAESVVGGVKAVRVEQRQVEEVAVQVDECFHARGAEAAVEVQRLVAEGAQLLAEGYGARTGAVPRDGRADIRGVVCKHRARGAVLTSILATWAALNPKQGAANITYRSSNEPPLAAVISLEVAMSLKDTLPVLWRGSNGTGLHNNSNQSTYTRQYA